jgi:hypothetical protein
MRATHLLLAACVAAIAALAGNAAAAAWADVANPNTPTAGCPIKGVSAVCPAYKSKHAPSKLAKRGVELRQYEPGVWAYLDVNASYFGSAAAATTPALNAYTGGANEAGFKFHDTAPSALRFAPTRDFASVGREFTAARFLDVASPRDAPPPTQNAMIRTCKTGDRDAAVWVAGWTSASPLPGPPTGATVLGHVKALAARLDGAGEEHCARSAWLLSYTPDGAVGRKYFEVTLDAGRCRSEDCAGGGGEQVEEVEEEEVEEEEVVPRPALVVAVDAQ